MDWIFFKQKLGWDCSSSLFSLGLIRARPATPTIGPPPKETRKTDRQQSRGQRDLAGSPPFLLLLVVFASDLAKSNHGGGCYEQPPVALCQAHQGSGRPWRGHPPRRAQPASTRPAGFALSFSLSYLT